jgi:integrase
LAQGIYKRGSVYWIRYIGTDKKIHRESSGSTKFHDAEQLYIKRREEKRNGRSNNHEPNRIADHTFQELAEEYLKWTVRQRCFRYKNIMIGQLLTTFKNYRLNQINTRLLEHYQAERIKRGNKASTVNRVIATVKHMYTKAVEWDMASEELLRRVRKVKLLEENNRRLRFLSKEECQSLIESCNINIRDIVIIALNTGMRKGEILSLKWDNVDLTHGFILLNETKNGDRREIPINDTARKILGRQEKASDIDYVFYNRVTREALYWIYSSFGKACRKAGIINFRFHDLRHTFASQLVMAGVDIVTVKELLGHKSLTMTLRYAHLSQGHKVKAVHLLDDKIGDVNNQLRL